MIATWGSVRCLLTCRICKWLTRRACIRHHGWIEDYRAVFHGESHKNRVGWQNIGDMLSCVEGNCGSCQAFLYHGASNWSMIGMGSPCTALLTWDFRSLGLSSARISKMDLRSGRAAGPSPLTTTHSWSLSKAAVGSPSPVPPSILSWPGLGLRTVPRCRKALGLLFDSVGLPVPVRQGDTKAESLGCQALGKSLQPQLGWVNLPAQPLAGKLVGWVKGGT